MKIGTHDSATGEPGKWWCFPLIPFAKTQSKTLKEQYAAGCTLFDLRIREYKGRWHFAHGPWVSKEPAENILKALGLDVITKGERIYVSITYEGKHYDEQKLRDYYQYLQDNFPEMTFLYLAVKFGKDSKGVKCKYDFLDKTNHTEVGCLQGFTALDGRSWHTYLPIPWLWKKIYHDNPSFSNTFYLYVDFL